MYLILDSKTSAKSASNHPVYWYSDRSVTAKYRLAKPTDRDIFTILGNSKLEAVIVLDEASLKLVEDYFCLGNDIRDSGVSFSDAAGCSTVTSGGVTILVTNSLALINSSRAEKFFLARVLQKLSKPWSFIRNKPLQHSHITHADSSDVHFIENMLAGKDFLNRKIFLMAIDLETLPSVSYRHTADNTVRSVSAVIDLIGFSIVCGDVDSSINDLEIYSYTLNNIYKWEHDLACKLFATYVPKVFSNGMYDVQYLFRWGITVNNYLWDTEYFLRASVSSYAGHYSLQQQSNQFVLHNKYWKNNIKTKIASVFRRYCATDCHNTAMVALAQMGALSKPNLRNFVISFAKIPYALSSSLRGMEIDISVQNNFRSKFEQELVELTKVSLNIFGCKPSQSAALLKGLQRLVDALAAMKLIPKTVVKGTSKEILRDLSGVSPIIAAYVRIIQRHRRLEKWLSTYVNVKSWSDLDNGGTFSTATKDVFLWSMHPFGTDSGRFSSRDSAFWCGSSAHTIPKEMRSMFVAPKGYVFGTTDAPQSETRITAYAARCRSLQERVEGELDFHMLQTAAFFGLNYEDVTDDLRNIGKRINHGANYNMGAYVMLVTMGIDLVLKARNLLGLPQDMKLVDVTKFLLDSFAREYPEVKVDWVVSLVTEALSTGRIVCEISGFAPIILGNPLDNKGDLNKLISIKPQSISAYISIKASMKLFVSWLYKDSPIIPLLQIHDENVILAPETTSVYYLDNYILEHCSNVSPIKWGDKFENLSIPVGELVFGRSWDKLKGKFKPRKSLEVQDYA